VSWFPTGLKVLFVADNRIWGAAHRCTRDRLGRGSVFEMLSIVCTAAALMQGGWIPDGMSINGAKKIVVPDGYEQMIAPDAFQLS
jgi:hypothetical protein